MDGRTKGILPIIKIPFLYYKREDKEIFYPLLPHINRNRDTHLGPAENGIYAYGDLSSLFSTMNRNGSKVCNKKYHGQPLFTPKPRDRNHQCKTTVLVALVMS